MKTGIQFEKDFAVIVKLINDSRYRAFRKVNVELIDLYWNIGKYICKRVEEADWGKSIVTKLSEYIVKNNPEIKGFTTSNLWRMKQFYETYPNDKKLAPAIRELPSDTSYIFRDQYLFEFLDLPDDYRQLKK